MPIKYIPYDNIYWYYKSDNYHFNRNGVLQDFESGMTKWRYENVGVKLEKRC